MPLHTKYRPESLDEFLGDCDFLSDYFEQDIEDLHHSYLITGPSGCGKTTLGRLIAKQFGIDTDSNAYREYNASSTRGIDTIRQVISDMTYPPMGSNYKVYLFDECHQITGNAQDALLKALEEPPKHVVFILCTTEPQKLSVTLKRRCFIIELKPLTSKEIAKLLEEIAEEESDEDLNDIIQSIAETCEGSPGIALQMLEDCIHSDNTEKTIEKYRMTKEEVIDLCRLLLKAKKWNEITKKLKLYKESGIDPETLRRAIVGYASSVLLNGDNPKAFLIYDAFERPTYDNGFAQIVGSAYTVFMDPERG